MVNKKKIKGTTAAKKNKAVESKKTEALPRYQGLSQAQLTALIFLSLGGSYVIDYGRAVHEGNYATACAAYFVGGVEDCSSADAALILVKYYEAISSTVLVVAAMTLCWTNEPLFQSLHSVLCISPLGMTLLAAYFSEGSLQQSKIFKLFMTVTTLLVVALSSIVKARLARPITSRVSSLQHVCLLSLSLVSGWEAIVLFRRGVEGYLQVDPEDVSKGTNSLLSFLAIDKITVSLLMLFAMFFFNDSRKRWMLLYVALTRLAELFLQLPNLESSLRDAEGIRSVMIGSAVFAGIAAFAPSLNVKKDG